MTTWGLRFRFLITKEHRIDDESNCLEILIKEKNQKLFLKTPDNISIRDSENLIITGGDFTSKKEAEEIGRRIKNSILLCGPILRIGFDIGNDKASFFTSKFIKDEAKKIGYQIIDDVHGLCFYEQYLPVKVVSGGSSIVIGNKPSRFSKVFKKMFDNNTRLSDKQMLALELYNSSFAPSN